MVGPDEQKNQPPPRDGPDHVVRYPRLQRGSHFADFMRDHRLSPEVYHCVIQREGSNAIFSRTQHSTLEAALKNAEVELTLILGSSTAGA